MDTLFLTFTFIICMVPVFSEVDEEKRLYEDLFIRQGYNKNVRPVRNASELITVEVQLVLFGLQNIIEIDGTMVTQSYFRTKWRDHKLVWNPSDYSGVSQMVLPVTEVWVPDLALSNSDNKFYDQTYKEDFRVSIQHTGEVFWPFGGTVATNCDMVLDKYPFDTQNCSFIIESWIYKVHQVELVFPPSGGIDINTMGSNMLWNFMSSTTDSILKYQQSHRALIFTIAWIRKPLFYYMNILLPAALLMVIALGIYWLPGGSGEKTSIGITVLLSFSVFQVIIMDSTPVNSEVVPELTQFVIAVMLLSSISLLTSTLVIYIRGRDANEPPNWLRFICYRILARILFMDVPPKKKKKDRSKYEGRKVIILRQRPRYPMYLQHAAKHNANLSASRPNTSRFNVKDNFDQYEYNNSAMTFEQRREEEEFNNFVKKTSKDVAHIRDFVSEIWKYKEEKIESDKHEIEWDKLSRIIDRLMFWLTLLLFIFSIMYIFIKSRYF